jgi:hypothetical protein
MMVLSRDNTVIAPANAASGVMKVLVSVTALLADARGVLGLRDIARDPPPPPLYLMTSTSAFRKGV